MCFPQYRLTLHQLSTCAPEIYDLDSFVEVGGKSAGYLAKEQSVPMVIFFPTSNIYFFFVFILYWFESFLFFIFFERKKIPVFMDTLSSSSAPGFELGSFQSAPGSCVTELVSDLEHRIGKQTLSLEAGSQLAPALSFLS